MKKYVIWVSEKNTKAYIRINPGGEAEAVSDKMLASVMPNRVVASSICAAIKPAIKKQGFDVKIGIDVV